MRQRRRAERYRFGVSFAKGQARRAAERSRMRLLRWGLAVFGVLIVLILGGGWYFTYFQPPREVVATVDSHKVRLSDLIPYTKMNGLTTGYLDPSTALNDYVRDMILQKQAGSLGITVTPQDVTHQIIMDLHPNLDPKSATATADQLSSSDQQTLNNILTALNVNEATYRSWVEGRVLTTKFQDHFNSQVQDVQKQAYVRWIVTQTQQNAQKAFDELTKQGKLFATVAQELNQDHTLADQNGNVGWMPQGVVPTLDPYLFGKNAKYGQVVGPINVSGLGYVVLLVHTPPSDETVSTQMRNLLGSRNFQTWMSQQVKDLVSNDSGLSTGQVNWVVNHAQ